MSRARILVVALLGGNLCGLPIQALAASGDEVSVAIAKAEAAEVASGKIRNQWTSTEAELKTARDAAAAKDFEKAMASANLAEAMAQRSIEQAHEQDTAWTEAVIR